MACNCHGKNGISTRKAGPFDQCTTCAKKHIVKAWNLFNEFTYEDDNRDVITGQLRNAADHLKYEHRDLALKTRDLAVMIEENRDNETAGLWENILTGVRAAFYADHPDARERLNQLRNTKEETSA